ncbi:carnitine O-acetyltransferase-like [Cololabis saira]|uniref:carnitine O-acetyltransferase-like n=1 Tax=Cololabis saira TaxID=129043 RepID=UPI002AD2C5BD|nr:carnitine O-acetyltransferase-like [Cololabis saira]
MWGICSRTLVGMAKSAARPPHLVRPVAAHRLPGRYLSHQGSLPSLPVPPLQQTCQRYLEALEPIMEPEELERSRGLVEGFGRRGGVGERLQRGLEERARSTDNWLSDWWVQVAYLDYRLPVVVHSSPGLVLPRMDFSDVEGQMRFAAKLITGVLDFKTMIDNESLPVEQQGGAPLCMHQYYQLFSSCRLPGLHQDSLLHHRGRGPAPTHITVVMNSQFFQVEVYGPDGAPLTEDQILVQLRGVRGASEEEQVEPVGILTSQHRDRWGGAYLELTRDETNRQSVSAIQSSIFTVCLDGPTPAVAAERYRSAAAVQMLHGGGSRLNSGNRWFDKTLQFIVGVDGTCGANYEHAPAEGPPIVALIDHVVEYTRKPDTVQSVTGTAPPAPRRLHFNLTPEIRRSIAEAKEHLDALARDLDVEVVVFPHFGKNVPKRFRMSPDAFVQMSLQLAYYRMYGRCCSTYESASLRRFRLGRTDTVRSSSRASLSFVRAFDDPRKQDTEKLDLMDKAVKAHRSYTDMAVSGQAIDRHLLGLKLQALEEKLGVPELFTDPAFSRALHYQLSTSQVPSKADCVMCFGPVVPDGYGVCYNPMETHINLALSAFNACPDTQAGRLARAVETALLDMRTLLETTARAKL